MPPTPSATSPPPADRPAEATSRNAAVIGVLATLLIAATLFGWIGASLWREDPATKARAAEFQRPIDVNAADHAALQLLPGIGPGLAQRIVDHRADHGPFASMADLRQVKGIGPATAARMRPFVAFGARLPEPPAADPE
jgi:competence ComEA-like helix-hairpin-helix protein